MKVLVTILGYVPNNSELMSKVHTPPPLGDGSVKM